MAVFNNLSQIQKYLEQNAMEVLANSAELERVLAEEVSQSVWDMVYAAYTPEQYERRGDVEGLSDTENYAITDWGIKDGKAFLIFENLTQGADNLSSVFLTDTIEEGIESNWSKSGEWSKPRPFIAEAVRRLKANPDGMKNAIRKGLASKGFKMT